MLEAVSFRETTRSVSRKIENPTSRGVALIDCWIQPGGVPLHWRVTSTTKPPLDVAINPMDGSLQGIQFVLQDEAVPHIPHGLLDDTRLLADRAPLTGVPSFDRSAWSADNRYLEEELPITAAWISNRDLCVVWVHLPAGVILECQVNSTLHLLFDANTYLVGYCLPNLTDDEKAAIRRAEQL